MKTDTTRRMKVGIEDISRYRGYCLMSNSVPSANFVKINENAAARTSDTAADHVLQRPRYIYDAMVSNATATHDIFTKILWLLMKITEQSTDAVNMPIEGKEKPSAAAAIWGRVDSPACEIHGNGTWAIIFARTIKGPKKAKVKTSLYAAFLLKHQKMTEETHRKKSSLPKHMNARAK